MATQFPQILAGMDPTASLLQSLAPIMAYKGGDQSVTSSTALVNDNALAMPVAANATYFFVMYVDYEGGTTGSSDMKWAWTFPAGLTMRYLQIGYAATTLTLGANSTFTQATAGGSATNGAANLLAVTFIGTIANSSTAGTLQWQWAQHTASATPTIVHAGSVFGMWRIS